MCLRRRQGAGERGRLEGGGWREGGGVWDALDACPPPTPPSPSLGRVCVCAQVLARRLEKSRFRASHSIHALDASSLFPGVWGWVSGWEAEGVGRVEGRRCEKKGCVRVGVVSHPHPPLLVLPFPLPLPPGRYMAGMLAEVLGDSCGFDSLNLGTNLLGDEATMQVGWVLVWESRKGGMRGARRR